MYNVKRRFKEQLESMDIKDLISFALRQNDETEQFLAELQEQKAEVKKLEEEKKKLQFRPSNNRKNQLELWNNDFSIKGRFMTQFYIDKDTNSQITDQDISDAVDVILTVLYNVNILKYNETIIRFADVDKDISEVEVLEIFRGVSKPNEVSQDFSTYYSKRYFSKFICPYGCEMRSMPTLREFEEAQHIIKTLFKYMSENKVSLASLHYTVDIMTAMKECAHRSNDTFYIARRSDSNQYFIPYYVENLNESLVWTNEYYNDVANNYTDLYFSKFVHPILKGKRD